MQKKLIFDPMHQDGIELDADKLRLRRSAIYSDFLCEAEPGVMDRGGGHRIEQRHHDRTSSWLASRSRAARAVGQLVNWPTCTKNSRQLRIGVDRGHNPRRPQVHLRHAVRQRGGHVLGAWSETP